jgi:hypothetical protein
MKKNLISIIAIAIILCFLAGCAAHIHKVGQGAQGAQKAEQRQWYVLWGLVPINEVNTNQMAEGATDYTIKTEQSALDVIINIFTAYISVVSRTVTVTK